MPTTSGLPDNRDPQRCPAELQHIPRLHPHPAGIALHQPVALQRVAAGALRVLAANDVAEGEEAGRFEGFAMNFLE